MFDLGTQELLVIFIVAFLVFGPRKLPELGRTLGKGIRDLKTAMRSMTDTFEEAGSDVTDELKGAKSSLEDSIYKSIESNFDRFTKEDKPEQRGAPEEKAAFAETEDDSKAEKKVTDKDG